MRKCQEMSRVVVALTVVSFGVREFMWRGLKNCKKRERERERFQIYHLATDGRIMQV